MRQIKVRRILTEVRQFVRTEGIVSEDHCIHDEKGRLGPLEELTFDEAAKIRNAKINATIQETKEDAQNPKKAVTPFSLS